MRWTDTAEENVDGAAAAATTSACLKGVTPRGDLTKGKTSWALRRILFLASRACSRHANNGARKFNMHTRPRAFAFSGICGCARGKRRELGCSKPSASGRSQKVAPTRPEHMCAETAKKCARFCHCMRL